MRVGADRSASSRLSRTFLCWRSPACSCAIRGPKMATRVLHRRCARQVANAVFVAFCLLVTAVALIALALILWSLWRRAPSGLNLNVQTRHTCRRQRRRAAKRHYRLDHDVRPGDGDRRHRGQRRVGTASEYGTSRYARSSGSWNDVLLSAVHPDRPVRVPAGPRCSIRFFGFYRQALAISLVAL